MNADAPSASHGVWPAGGYLLGLDIGGSKCAVLAGTPAGVVLERRAWPSRAERGPSAMLAEIHAYAAELAGPHGPPRAVGVAIGGPLDAAAGVVCSPPNLPGWDGIALRRLLEERWGCPVGVEHDAAACALAEVLWGGHGRSRRLAYLTCATGFGVGLVIDGVPYYGARGRSPEIGHVLLDPDGPEAFGIRGCAEAFCSARSLGRIASWKYPARWPTPPEPQRLQALAAAGDADAAAVVAVNAAMTGRVCALLADLFHPDRIVLGSLARYLGPSWVEAVRRECRRLALPDAADDAVIAPASLGERLQDLSALAAAQRALSAAPA
ncbi:MAG: ROK family protein [Lentisphaerae bacterium]|nr:ROK family protein [Lentisphaerota bacterium]